MNENDQNNPNFPQYSNVSIFDTVNDSELKMALNFSNIFRPIVRILGLKNAHAVVLVLPVSVYAECGNSELRKQIL